MATTLNGCGIGLRPEHYRDFVAQPQLVGWLEILSDNYLVPGGKPLHYLDLIRRDYAMSMHGVAMNLGSCDALDMDYLRQIRALAARVEPVLISDHLCWTGVDGRRLHDLMPLPNTEEGVKHVAERICIVQDYLGRRLLVENVSSYIQASGDMSEWEFIAEVAEAADCHLLLDVNNVYVSSRNHDFDPEDYLCGLPASRIREIHIAGHTDLRDHCIDTHDESVCADVWALFRLSIQMFGPQPTLLERDDAIPALGELLAELDTARELLRYAQHEVA